MDFTSARAWIAAPTSAPIFEEPDSMYLLPEGEVPISLHEAAALVPGGADQSTLNRWHHQGLRGHKLECERVGFRLKTSREAVRRFLKRIASAMSAA
jgi:hypothetical protein